MLQVKQKLKISETKTKKIVKLEPKAESFK